MNFYGFKISNIEKAYYVYIVSYIEDLDLNLDVFQSYCEENSNDEVCQFFMLCTNNWESVDIGKSNISCIDIINKNISMDNKCINVSNEYVKVLNDTIEEAKQKKSKKVAKPKAKPKPKANKVIIQPSGTVKFD